MIEYKEIRIIDSDTSDLINNMTAFGWEVVNNSASTYSDHIVNSVGNIVVHDNIHHTENILTFKRDTSMPYYNELNELYFEYIDCYNDYVSYPTKPTKKNSGVFLWIGTIMSCTYALMGLIFAIIDLSLGELIGLLVLFISLGLCALSYFLIRQIIKQKKKYNADFMNAVHTNSDNDERIKELVKQGRKILKSIVKENPDSTKKNQSVNNSNLDEIRKLKELLDIGAITQEDYDQKKKELLKL